MIKRILSILTICILIIGMVSNVNAANTKTTLEITKSASDTKYLENDQGYISKTIVNSNKDTGEVTIELKLNNQKKEQLDNPKYEKTEIYIIVSENIVNDTEKLNKYLANIENLSSKIFSQNSQTKVGIIGIKGTVADATTDAAGNMIWGDKDEGEVNGSEANAEVVVQPTNDLNAIKTALQNMNPDKIKYRTNLQAAIKLANKSYSENVNRMLISLYDSVPSIAIGVCHTVHYGVLYQYSTAEAAVKAQHEKIANNTRNEILTLKNSNTLFFLLRPDDTSYDETWYSTSTGEKILDFDGSPYVQKLYGTMDNPTYGKIYSFTEDNIDTIITENIYKDIKENIQPDMKEVKVVDYFPDDIINNFEFSYVEEPTVGTVSDKIDEETKTISWDIGTLRGDETASLKYKLKLKDMNNAQLLNKEIDTNQKVVLTYKDIENKEYEVILDSSPKIMLKEVPKVQNGGNNTASKDNTIAKDKLPNTGEVILMWVIGIVIISAVVAHIRYKKLYM